MNDISINVRICYYDECFRKIKLTDYPCKCGNYYCKFHHFYSNHNCIYDYKKKDIQKKIDELKSESFKINKI